jgi:hypothetical protein
VSTPSRGRIAAPAPGARSPVPTRLALLLSALVLSPGGCVPHLLDWEIGWSETGLENRFAAVEASILSGGCGGGTVLWIEEVRLSTGWETPPNLGAGRYGFAARARDAHCVWYAQGCREIDLPASDQAAVLVVLEPAAPAEPACAPELCLGGACACVAPGECGSACVSGDCSCSGRDCAMRCTADRACSCPGGGCNVRCEGGATCDCPGGNCVMDCAAGALCSCEGGDCTMACVEGAECSCRGGGCR